MSKRDVADDLFSVVMKRYKKEKLTVHVTSSMMDTIWFVLYGKVREDGEEKAKKYAETTELVW